MVLGERYNKRFEPGRKVDVACSFRKRDMKYGNAMGHRLAIYWKPGQQQGMLMA